MRSVRYTARVFAGLVFVFSGISKGIDPMGSMYKFTDYFTAFGLDSLNNLSLILGVALCAAEFIIGFALLSGIRVKEASWGLILFMAGFTPLTFILALNNPVSDCGCFGDAIHLSNWQTFYKNIVIMAVAVVVFSQRKKYKVLSDTGREWILVGSITLIFLLFVQLNYRYLPVIDFRPYGKGENIIENMSVPEGSPVDEYEVMLIYEKDGEEREFTIENYPSADSGWIFVDQKSTLVKKGYKPPIHDFSLVTLYGEDITDEILHDPGYSLFLISTQLSDARDETINQCIEVGLQAMDAGISFYVFTSSSENEISMLPNDITILTGDETTIKTVIRSNPGLLLIKDGNILEKWSKNSIPEIEYIIDNLERIESKRHISRLIKFLLIMGIVLLLSAATVRLIKRKE